MGIVGREIGLRKHVAAGQVRQAVAGEDVENERRGDAVVVRIGVENGDDFLTGPDVYDEAIELGDADVAGRDLAGNEVGRGGGVVGLDFRRGFRRIHDGVMQDVLLQHVLVADFCHAVEDVSIEKDFGAGHDRTPVRPVVVVERQESASVEDGEDRIGLDAAGVRRHTRVGKCEDQIAGRYVRNAPEIRVAESADGAEAPLAISQQAR